LALEVRSVGKLHNSPTRWWKTFDDMYNRLNAIPALERRIG